MTTSHPEPGDLHRSVAVQLPELLAKLRPSSDPGQVFTHLASLLTGSVCDDAVAHILTGDPLARWHERPPLTSHIPAAVPSPDNHHAADGSHAIAPKTFAVTVHICAPPPGGDDWTSQDDYVAVLTCTWHHYRPTPADVACLQLAGRAAAELVHRSQQAELLRAQQEHLRVGRISTHLITAIGALMRPEHAIDHQQ